MEQFKDQFCFRMSCQTINSLVESQFENDAKARHFTFTTYLQQVQYQTVDSNGNRPCSARHQENGNPKKYNRTKTIEINL